MAGRKEQWTLSLSCSLLMLLIASIVAGLFGADKDLYDRQEPARCEDVRNADGVAEVTTFQDTRRRRASEKEINCRISTRARTQASDFGNEYNQSYRTVKVLTGIKWGADSVALRAQAKSMCKEQILDGSYNCYFLASSQTVLLTPFNYPTATLVCTCVFWSLFGLCCPCAVWSMCCSNSVSQKEVQNNTTPTSTAVVHPECIESPSLPVGKGTTDSCDKFRKLTEADLCVELIPGLHLRVLWPASIAGARWFAATATSYDNTQGEESVTLQWDESNGFQPTVTIKISDDRVRLHENALEQVARKRILSGAVSASIFGSNTFQSLDTNGDGIIKVSEIQDGLRQIGIELDSPTLNALVRMIDLDGSGEVDAREFKDFLNKSV